MQHKDYLWNSIAGLINASEAVLMSMIVTRYGMLADAGVLSLAFAVGNVLMAIGKFGGRMYQVTDVKKQYSFGIYIVQKTCTVALMLALLFCVLFAGGYKGEKRSAIILISVIFAIEAFEESFWGLYQLYDRLYIGAQMFTTRWAAAILVFSFVMMYSHNMVMALTYSAIATAIVFTFWLVFLPNKPDFKWFDGESTHLGLMLRSLKTLFKQTAPLFVASFCSIFISNLPKFAIDRHLNDEIQACYGFVAMPVFVIGMLNQFIYQPTVVKLTREYHDGDFGSFRVAVRKQVMIVSGIACLCLCGAGLIGIPVLSLIYHTDLSAYWKELVILQVAGGFLALSGYFNILLTLMRKQNVILVGYTIILLMGIIILNMLVLYAGTIGASAGYAVLMMMLFLFFLGSYYFIIHRQERKESVS